MKKVATFSLLIFLVGLATNRASQSKSDPCQDSRSSLVRSAAIQKPGLVNKEAILAKAASISIPFIKNIGQFKGEVTYAADLFAGRFFLTNKELVYLLRKPGENERVQPGKRELEAATKKRPVPGESLVFREFFVNQKGVKIDFKSVGEQQAETVVSYFKGSDSSRWRSGVASYQGVSLGQVYPGVEVKLKASGGNVEKVFYVNPRGKVDAIRIGVAGVAGLEIAKDGRLLLKNNFGELAMRAPIAWQEIDGQRHDVKVGYRLIEKNLYGFSVTGSYDKNHTLIIDPDLDTLMASTYLGGSSVDVGTSLAVDRAGNVFIAGYTYSREFPTAEGAYDRKFHLDPYPDPEEDGLGRSVDVFVAKLNSSLTTLLASTFIGGAYEDKCHSLTLDSAGNVFLTGETQSSDFPTTPMAFDREIGGWIGDIFIAKLSNDLSALSASTFLGGEDHEVAYSMALDSSDNVYVTGKVFTSDSPHNPGATDFPTTPGAYDRINNGNYDVFVSKLDANLTALLASTYLGGKRIETAYSIALDSLNNVYVTGDTDSSDFPTTIGAYDKTYNDALNTSPGDGFVSKFDGRLTQLLASTFLGGTSRDGGRAIALARTGDVYLTGFTWSTDFPTAPGAYDRENIKGDAFITSLDNNLSELQTSTFLGGSGGDWGSSLVLDFRGNVYVSGSTSSPDFPTTYGAYDQGYNKNTDVFVSKFNRSLTVLLTSTYLGGSDQDSCSFMAFDHSGNVYLLGSTRSYDFPTIVGTFDGTYDGDNWWWGGDVFVSKLNTPFSISPPGTVSDIAVISPNGRESWLAGTTQDIAWETIGTIADVKIEYTHDNGARWIEVIASTANNGIYPWTVPATPSRRCLVRISDVVNAAISGTSDAAFSILLGLDLQAERREIRALSIMRQYGAIRFLYANPDYPVAQYRLMRRKGNEVFVLLKTIAPSELQNNQFQMQDKYLEKDIPYTYRVEAYDAAGQLIGISSDKTI